MKHTPTGTGSDPEKWQLREMNEALLLSSIRQHEMTEQAERAAAALHESEERLNGELAATRVLQDISTRLIQGGDIHELHERILDAAMAIMGSTMASLQNLDEDQNALRLLAFRGFDPEFGRTFELVRRDAGTSGSVAWRIGCRVIVPDVETCDFIVGTAALEHLRRAGIRAVQSTPLISRSGSFLGMISTHWRQPHQPSDRDLHLFDILARQVADLIEQKLAEEALRSSEARLLREAAARVLLNQLSSRLWRMPGMRDGLEQVLDAILELLGAEKGCVQLFDAERRVLRIAAHRGFDQEFLDFFREVSLQDDSACGRALRTGERVLIEDTEADPAYAPHLSITTAAGFRALQSTPLIGRDGTILGVLSTHFRCVQRFSGQKFRWLDLFVRQATDFIERNLVEEGQRDSERHKDEFLAILAHELRNPLGPIRNAAHYLRLKEVSPDLSPPLEMIERQVRHMVRLIDDLLDVSRISRGALELRLEQVRLTEVVEAAIDACSMEIHERRHKLHVNLPEHVVLLRGDRARLIQVLCNLLTNAAKFTSPGGVIELVATATGGTLVLRVIDNGMGIPPDKLNAIFELFTQVDRSLERQGGLGIGLTLVRQLIELHGGSINAKSDGIGRGSEFILTLPITAADAASAGISASPAPVMSSKSRRILVADDNHDAAKSLTLLLRQGGHEVYIAFDGTEAVVSAQDCRPEVMILDIGMPGMNGYDVARRIREQPWAKGVCLVALTGWGQEVDRHRAREAGFDAHLVKPVDLDAINALLATL